MYSSAVIARPAAVLLFFSIFLPSSRLAAQGTPLPFERGVRIEVVISKPAPIRGGDYDDKLQKIVLRAKFTNMDTRQSYEGHTATISAFGQSTVDRTARMVLLQEKVDLPLTPLQNHEHTCKQVTTRFDKTGAKFGYFYDGWIMVIKDKAGKIVHVKSTSPTLEKLADKADKITPGKCYDKNLEVVEAPDSGYTS